MKIAIICQAFKKSNKNKQPWKYIYEMIGYLKDNHNIFVITDMDKHDFDDIRIISIKRLFIPLLGESKELLGVLEHENPDKCIMMLGLSSFLRFDFKIKQPVIGVFTSPTYSIKELIKNIGLFDSIKYHKYTALHFLNAIIPNIFIKRSNDYFSKIIFLSKYSQNKIIEKGFPESKSYLVPCGIDRHFFEKPDYKEVKNIKNKLSPKIPIVMYFTSPLTLRGTDTLAEAFIIAKKTIPMKLILLSRVDYDELEKEENIIKNILKNENSQTFEIISKYLKPKELKNYLSAADIICLPFKIVISDVPISILEAQVLNKPVISTKVASIPEILNENCLMVEPNDEKKLADAIAYLLQNMPIGKSQFEDRDISYFLDWESIAEKFIKIIS